MTARFQGINVKINSKLRALKKIAASFKRLAAFLMFGSYAQGKETPLSDVDFAFLTKPGTGPEAEEKLDRGLYRELARTLKTDDITLVNLREAPLMLAFNVLRGRVLFCSDEAVFKNYKERILTFYPDLKMSRESFLKTFVQKFKKV